MFDFWILLGFFLVGCLVVMLSYVDFLVSLEEFVFVLGEVLVFLVDIDVKVFEVEYIVGVGFLFYGKIV